LDFAGKGIIMAEKAEKKPESPAQASAPAKESKGGLLTKTPVVLGGVMLIEAIVLFAGFKVFGGKPQPAAGAELAAMDAADGHGTGKGSSARGKTVEVSVVDFKALNRSSGRTFLYDVSIYVVIKADKEQKVKDTFKDGKALIEDRIRTIIAESDPEKLGGGSEPGLETLRRQVKYQLDGIVGEGVIDEVLIPRCIPFRTDY
jgi:flagellar basal body-associated protein FliL